MQLPSRFSIILILLGVATIKGYGQFPMNLPTLNPGDSIIVSFVAEIGTDAECDVSCQAEVTIGMTTILSDDPDTGAPDDPTVTVLEDTDGPIAACNDLTVNLPVGDYVFTPADSATIVAGTSDLCGTFMTTFDPPVLSCLHIGVNDVTVTYTDEAGNMSMCIASVTLLDPLAICCDLPTAVCQNVTAYLDDLGNVVVSPAAVNNGSTADCGLLSLNLNPATFDCADVGNVAVVLTVTDENGNTATCSAIVTVVDTTAPTLVCPGDITIECGSGYPEPNPDAIIADDNCDVALVTFVGDVTNGMCPEIVTRSYRAMDVNGNAGICTQRITITDTTPPFISCPEDTNFECAERTCLTFDEYIVNPIGTPVVIDTAFAGDIFVEIFAWRKGGIQMDATLFDSEQSTIDPDLGTPNTLYGGPGVNEHDPDGFNATNNRSLGKLLIVQNPNVTYPNDNLLSDSLVYVFSEPVYVSGLSVLDFEVEQVLSGAGVYLYDVSGAELDFVPLNPALGGDNSMEELYLNTYGVKKLVVYFGNHIPSSGGVGNLCFTHVRDETAISDLCALDEVIVEEEVATEECITSITRYYTAIDACGNPSTATCFLTLEGDYAQPEVICPDDITIGCEDPLPPPDPGSVVIDNCSNDLSATWVEDIVSGEDCEEVIRRIYRSTDECGNEALCVQYITRQEPPMIQLMARVLLGGPMETGDEEMDPMINELLPEEQPYDEAPFNYPGPESVEEFPENIVDWVLLDLRNVSTMEVISQRCALVTAEGDIVDLDGVSPVTFIAPEGQYYVVICHRNHLDVMSDGPVDFNAAPGNLDLTLGNAGMIEVSPGVWAMIKGDVTMDGIINNTDLITLAPYAATGYSNEYLHLDVNMDGLVNNTDLVLLAPFAAIGYTQGF